MQRFRPAALLWIILSTMLGGVFGLLFGLEENEYEYLDFAILVFCVFGFFAGIPAALTVLIMTFARVNRRRCAVIGAAVAFLGWSLVLVWVDLAFLIIFAAPIAVLAGVFFLRTARPPADERPWVPA